MAVGAKVGIGTTAPETALEISTASGNDASAITIRSLDGSSNALRWEDDGWEAEVGYNGTDNRMWLDVNGNNISVNGKFLMQNNTGSGDGAFFYNATGFWGCNASACVNIADL